MNREAILMVIIALSLVACESVPSGVEVSAPVRTESVGGTAAEETEPAGMEPAEITPAEIDSAETRRAAGMPPERTSAGEPGLPRLLPPGPAAPRSASIPHAADLLLPLPWTPLPEKSPSLRTSADGPVGTTVARSLPDIDVFPERAAVNDAYTEPAETSRSSPATSEAASQNLTIPPDREEDRSDSEGSPVAEAAALETTETVTTEVGAGDDEDTPGTLPPGPTVPVENTREREVPRVSGRKDISQADGGPPSPALRETADPEEASTSRRTAAPGDVVRVTLPGPSWLFLRSSGNSEFLSRETAPDLSATNFLFRVTGPAHLSFESQDLTTGTRTVHEEFIAVGDAPAERAAAQNGRGDGERPSAAGGGGADSATASETMTAAAEANTGPIGELTPFDADTHSRLIASVREEGEETANLTIEEMVAYVDLLTEEERWDAAGPLLETLWQTPRWQSDEVLFRLARFHDVTGPSRDVEYALELYETLIRRYPFSSYLERAEERERYLKRHFFYIR